MFSFAGLENDSDSEEQIPVRQFTLAESRALSDSGASLHMVPKSWSGGESSNGMKKQSCWGADGHFTALMKKFSWWCKTLFHGNSVVLSDCQVADRPPEQDRSWNKYHRRKKVGWWRLSEDQ